MIESINSRYGRAVVYTLLAMLVLVMGHWALNTLAGLLSGLQLEFRHTLAIATLLLIARWLWSAGHARAAGQGHDAITQVAE